MNTENLASTLDHIHILVDNTSKGKSPEEVKI
jgi:hypothetical protein